MFINSKLFTSLLVAVVIFVVCSIFGVPYALLLCLIMGIFNLIPFFGPIVGGIICLLLLLVFSPGHFLLFLITVVIVQAVEGLARCGLYDMEVNKSLHNFHYALFIHLPQYTSLA